MMSSSPWVGAPFQLIQGAVEEGVGAGVVVQGLVLEALVAAVLHPVATLVAHGD